VRRLFLIIRRVEATILSGSVIAMAAITIVNVFARNLLRRNLAAAEELNQFLIVLVCFVGLSYAASQGRHIRMTALYDQLGPRPRKVLMVVISATTSALMFFLAWFALSYAWSVDRTSPVLGVPLYVVYLAAPLGLFLAGVQYLLTLIRNLRSDEVYIAFDHTDAYHEIDGQPGEV
jgi:TRAP-type C4-dicarboxylate transport system permease small subunit